jgi:hypothetical protein
LDDISQRYCLSFAGYVGEHEAFPNYAVVKILHALDGR